MLKIEGPWWADMWKCSVEEVRKRWLESILLGRFGTPEDVARIVFLFGQ